MAYSYNEVTATGSAQLIAVPEYVDQSHIFVSINGVDTTSFTWTNANTVSVTATAGTKVRVYRKTSPGARVVDYLDGMSLTEAVLDADSKQAFFLAQEQLDSTNDAVSAIGSLPTALAAIQAETASSTANAASAASSASSAASSATAASASATSASTSATNAGNSATAAASSASAAATSATNAAASESTATTKASEAFGYAATAATKASEAATSATNAASSATAAAASAASINDASLLHKAGAETVTGVKTFQVPARGTVTADNDLSFDLNATNYFSCTPTAGGTLTFTNIVAGQSGHILLTNGSNYAITAAATTKINAADLTAISATGTYLLSYFSNGTNVYVVVSRSFS